MRRRWYKRKYQRYRKKYRRYKRAYRSRTRIRRGSSRYVHVARTSQANTVVYSSAGGSVYLASFEFKLNNMLNYTDFTNLFQEYRLNCVVVKFTPQWTTNDISNMTANTTTGSSVYTSPGMVFALDYNDASTPSSLNDLHEFSNSKDLPFNRAVKIKIWPACSPGVYISAVSAGYAVKRKLWLRSANSDIPHYGLKYGIYNIAAGVNYRWNYIIKYYVSFRQMF